MSCALSNTPERGACSAVVEAQNALTQTVLAQCDSRDNFKELMTRLYDYERYGCPYKCVRARMPRCCMVVMSMSGVAGLL